MPFLYNPQTHQRNMTLSSCLSFCRQVMLLDWQRRGMHLWYLGAKIGPYSSLCRPYPFAPSTEKHPTTLPSWMLAKIQVVIESAFLLVSWDVRSCFAQYRYLLEFVYILNSLLYSVTSIKIEEKVKGKFVVTSCCKA